MNKHISQAFISNEVHASILCTRLLLFKVTANWRMGWFADKHMTFTFRHLKFPLQAPRPFHATPRWHWAQGRTSDFFCDFTELQPALQTAWASAAQTDICAWVFHVFVQHVDHFNQLAVLSVCLLSCESPAWILTVHIVTKCTGAMGLSTSYFASLVVLWFMIMMLLMNSSENTPDLTCCMLIGKCLHHVLAVKCSIFCHYGCPLCCLPLYLPPHTSALSIPVSLGLIHPHLLFRFIFVMLFFFLWWPVLLKSMKTHIHTPCSSVIAGSVLIIVKVKLH